MNEEKIHDHPFSSNFYRRRDFDWWLFVLSVTTQVFFGNKIKRCQSCLTYQDLLGLIASVGIQKFPSLIPFVVFETDKTVAMKLPFPVKRIHYVIIPKKDIKNIGEISEADTQYLTDAFFVVRWIIEEKKLSKYRFYTNGPGSQNVTYLHFHLVAE